MENGKNHFLPYFRLLQNSKLYLASLTKPPAPQLQPSHQSSSSSLSSLAENSFNSSRNGNGGSSAVGSTQFPPSIFHHLPPPPPSNPFPYVNLNASSHLQSSKNAVVEQQPVDDDLLEYRNLIERRGYRSILENNNNDTTNEEKEDNKR
jgi:hypothetical protein